MNIIGSKKLCALITNGLLDVTSVTSRCFSNVEMVDSVNMDKFMEDLEIVSQAGIFDIIRWKYCVSDGGIVTLTADLHGNYIGEYIEVLGKVADGLSVNDFKIELEAFGVRV